MQVETFLICTFNTLAELENTTYLQTKMSHFTKIKTKLYDRVTIEKSLSDLNIEWESSSETLLFGYNNQD